MTVSIKDVGGSGQFGLRAFWLKRQSKFSLILDAEPSSRIHMLARPNNDWQFRVYQPFKKKILLIHDAPYTFIQ